MPTSRDEILDSALQLPEADRLVIAERLLETVPDEAPGMSVEDSEFLAELEQRFNDKTAPIPVSQLWQQD